jgi:hypothetical protein
MILNPKDHSWPNTYLYESGLPLDPKYAYANYKSAAANYNHDTYGTYSEGYDDFSMAHFVQNKQETIQSRMKLLYDEINHRHKLKDKNIYQINWDQCACKSLIYTMGEDIFDKKRLELERKILDLEQEKRREEATFFRDISFLNKELRDTLIEKIEEKQKAALVLGQGEETPCHTYKEKISTSSSTIPSVLP